jgi:hypothetical protein
MANEVVLTKKFEVNYYPQQKAERHSRLSLSSTRIQSRGSGAYIDPLPDTLFAGILEARPTGFDL